MLWLLKLVVDEVLVAGRIELLYPYAGLYGSVVALSRPARLRAGPAGGAVVERLVLRPARATSTPTCCASRPAPCATAAPAT